MDKGKVIAYGTHDELIKLVGGQTRIDLTLNVEGEKVLEAWKGVEGVEKLDSLDGKVTVLVDDSNRVLPRLFEAASKVGVRITSVVGKANERGLKIRSIDIREPNLEAVFLHLTGRALRD